MNLLVRAFLVTGLLLGAGGALAQQGGNGSVLSHDGDTSQDSESGSVRISAAVMDGLCVSKVDASTPEEARRAKVSGTVVVAITVNREGRVVRANSVSGPELLRDAAAEAVQKWRYTPYQLNGKTVSVSSTALVAFYPGK